MPQLHANQPVDMMEIARQTALRDTERLPRGAVKVVAPAKVNLVFRVGPRRDDGYHDVLNVMQTLLLHDVLYLWPLEEAPGVVTCECRTFENLPPLDTPAERNLAVRAVRALAEHVFLSEVREAGGVEGSPAFPGIGMRIEKHIPAQAGLGGGSADAAAALVGAAALWKDAAFVPSGVLARVGATLGADVPFFLQGGAALMTGTGTELSRTFASRKEAAVIIKPDAGLSTAAVYRAFDEDMTAEAAAAFAELRDNCCDHFTQDKQNDLFVWSPLVNDLQASAIRLLPEVGRIIAFAQAQPGVTAVQMSGSGSAVFAICTDFGSACKLTANAKLHGWWARTTAFGSCKAAVIPA